MKKSDITANKKIIILTSSGGGGHISATAGISSYVQGEYQTEPVYIFKELLRSLDIFSTLTLGRYSGEDFYNSFIPKKQFRLLGLLYTWGSWYIQLRKKKIHVLLRDYFIRTEPALIISVVPIINNIILDVAQELGIPFLLIPTDLDMRMYLLHINKPRYAQFYLGLSFDDQQIMAPVKNALIPENQIFIIGPPLQLNFFTTKNKDLIKKNYAIDGDKPIIMVLMGAQGSCETEKYVAQLLTIQTAIHIIVCNGKNGEGKKKLLEMVPPPHITLSIVGFIDHIADYMAIADILISKSGSQSVCEALYMNTPIFLDATSTLLPWEAFNHSFITHHQLGGQIKNYDDIQALISSLINQPETVATYKKNLENLPKKNCPQELRSTLRYILLR